ncbi:hypothetical protein XELAEV_18022726mg [Xenopus laevis]|uniref:Uncharacterized protein n=1 Tax=Xenopus laevis TaxID=8355 RepID=A0A974HNZ3_XENLA|nr:hypothetical protein XELAEV_18022726mg [Xenopus laevis]
MTTANFYPPLFCSPAYNSFLPVLNRSWLSSYQDPRSINWLAMPRVIGSPSCNSANQRVIVHREWTPKNCSFNLGVSLDICVLLLYLPLLNFATLM